MIVRATKTSLVIQGVPIKDKKFEKYTKQMWNEVAEAVWMCDLMCGVAEDDYE